MTKRKTSAMPPMISQRRADPRLATSGVGGAAASAAAGADVDSMLGPSDSVTCTLPSLNRPLPNSALPKNRGLSIVTQRDQPCQPLDGRLGLRTGGRTQDGTPARAGPGVGPDRP